ncbi:FkbM family methyltransferase [Allorhodopirellula solitaria]|uniref:Methyltransferase domain protein n=1 Tax=Allorhodopirellula solitaria TaxID=2527987 RepID=A0A5C5YB72_9BACT|nr:FkbM family methyltransferase [Allorhodopirellula solitaria]TWT72947.1 Methyltransferase domain protein [Allorhodopirellula solitaria]
MKLLRDFVFRVRYLGRGVPRAVGDRCFRFDESLRRWNFDQEAEVRQCIEANVKEGGVAVDVGANFGLHTLVMADRVGASGSVLAFEPVTENLRLLRRNISLNGFSDRVSVVDSAVSDLDEATIEMHVDSDALEPSASIATSAGERVAVRVGNQSLDSATSALTESQNCFVKIDVEGAELSVLRSGLGFLDRVRPTLLIEVHDYALPQFGESTESVYKFLQDHGFEIQQLSDMANHNGSYHHIIAIPSVLMGASSN